MLTKVREGFRVVGEEIEYGDDTVEISDLGLKQALEDATMSNPANKDVLAELFDKGVEVKADSIEQLKASLTALCRLGWT